MKIILAAPRGFCAGVNMAVASVERALEIYGPPLFVYHEIIHNNWIVKKFEREGVIFVEHLDDVPAGAHLLFSAHGVSPQIRETARERQLLTIDATCPLVRKVHIEAERFARQGFSIFLIGHAGHDEVVGTMGVAPQQIQLVEDVADVAGLQAVDPEKTAYLMQTTLSVDDAQLIVDELRKRFPEIVGPPKDDICYASKNRQSAVRELVLQADLALIIGSPSSSNSQRLCEVARSEGRPAYLIDGPQDIQAQWFKGCEKVLISAGASGPETLVQACVTHLKKCFQATVEEVSLGHERVSFPLPLELQSKERQQVSQTPRLTERS